MERRLRNFLDLFQPGVGLKRWLVIVFVGLVQMALGTTFWLVGLMDGVRHRWWGRLLTLRFLPRFGRGLVFLLSGALMTYEGWQRLSRSVMRVMVPEQPETGLTQLLFERQRAERGRRVVVFGGEPGLSPVLSALRALPQEIRVDVVLPLTEPGNVAQELRSKFGLSGAQVLYPTTDDAEMVARLDDGRLLEGASTINRVAGGRIAELFLSRNLRRVQVWESEANGRDMAARLRDYMPNPAEAALGAVSEAELILFAPGHLYTQVLSSLTLPRLGDAVRASRAPKVFVANLMTEPGKTDGWTIADHLQTIRDLSGVAIDYVIAHQGAISDAMQTQYRNEGAGVVRMEADATMSRLIFADTGEQTTLVEGAVVLGGDLVTEAPQIVTFQRGGDTILREMPVVRHDPAKLAPLLEQLLTKEL